MKKCPNCQKTYEDNLKYCQSDGTPLVVVAEETPDDPYKTMVASDLDLPAEEAVESGSSEPVAEEPQSETSDEATPDAAPVQEDIGDVLEIPDAAEPVDPMKTVIVTAGDTSDNIKVPDVPVQETAAEADSTPVSGQSSESDHLEAEPSEADSGDVDAVEEQSPAVDPAPVASEAVENGPIAEEASGSPVDSFAPEIPKFSEPELESPDLSETDSGPIGAKSPGGGIESKRSVPIPSPFEESMPPGFLPPETPPFDDASPPASPFTDQDEKSTGGTEDWGGAPSSGAVPAEVSGSGPFGSNEIMAPGDGESETEEGENKTLAIVSLISGIVGVLCCAAGILFGPVALITGYMAKSKITQDPSVYGGSTFANIGMILGVVGVVLSILVIALNLFSVLSSF